MPNIKVIIKNTSPKDREKFKKASCLLLVSVGSEAHEGERFAATVDLINANFGSCTISLYDSLQRYTMALNSDQPPEAFHAQARLQGDLWLERNKVHYEKLENLKEIVRWDRWIASPRFPELQEQLRAEVQRNPDYKAAFQHTISTYLSRYIKHTGQDNTLDQGRIQTLCFEYLLEECTALCLWTELKCEYEVYTSERNMAMSATHRIFVLPKYDLLHPLRIGFKNAPPLSPQHQNFIFDDFYSEPNIKKMSLSDQVHMLEAIIAAMPGHVYWVSRKGYYLGCNDNQAMSSGLNSRVEIVGKYNKDLPWNAGVQKLAQELDAVNQQVMTSGQPTLVEEPGTFPDGREAIFLSSKKPLRNSHGETVGMLGISIDITSEKEAEHLRLENALQANTIELQRKISQIAAQVSHDIKSPLASLDMFIKSMDNLSEEKRLTLKRIAKSIDNIAAHLLNQYSPQKIAEGKTEESKEVVLLSPWLQQIISDKELQYQQLPIEFVLEIPAQKSFECLMVQRVALTRTLSNLINNAVDAMKDQKKPAVVSVSLDADLEFVRLSVKDTGKGIPAHHVKKILEEVAFTHGKENGHGIGLTQVRETLKANDGKLSIESKEGVGTEMILTFPSCEKPQWLGYELRLNANDHLIILDDDPSIHDVWETRFRPLRAQYPELQLTHFTNGLEALSYVKAQKPEEKAKIFLLTDYELLKQTVTGLDVIAESGLSRALLVTSYYSVADVQAKMMRMGARILPKQLAPEIAIRVSQPVLKPEKIDIVFLEDDALYASMVIPDIFCGLTVKHYLTPEAFLRELPHLDLVFTTPISIDKNFAQSKMDGIKLGAKLHEMGFNRLYLCTGETLARDVIPAYFTVLDKHELSKILQG